MNEEEWRKREEERGVEKEKEKKGVRDREKKRKKEKATTRSVLLLVCPLCRQSPGQDGRGEKRVWGPAPWRLACVPPSLLLSSFSPLSLSLSLCLCHPRSCRGWTFACGPALSCPVLSRLPHTRQAQASPCALSVLGRAWPSFARCKEKEGRKKKMWSPDFALFPRSIVNPMRGNSANSCRVR